MWYLHSHDLHADGLDGLQLVHAVVDLLLEVVEVELQALPLLEDGLGLVEAGRGDPAQVQEVLLEAVEAELPEELDGLGAIQQTFFSSYVESGPESGPGHVWNLRHV